MQTATVYLLLHPFAQSHLGTCHRRIHIMLSVPDRTLPLRTWSSPPYPMLPLLIVPHSSPRFPSEPEQTPTHPNGPLTMALMASMHPTVAGLPTPPTKQLGHCSSVTSTQWTCRHRSLILRQWSHRPLRWMSRCPRWPKSILCVLLPSLNLFMTTQMPPKAMPHHHKGIGSPSSDRLALARNPANGAFRCLVMVINTHRTTSRLYKNLLRPLQSLRLHSSARIAPWIVDPSRKSSPYTIMLVLSIFHLWMRRPGKRRPNGWQRRQKSSAVLV